MTRSAWPPFIYTSQIQSLPDGKGLRGISSRMDSQLSGADIPPRPFKINYRPMTVEDIPQVHQLDQRSFSLPWPERSFLYEITQNTNAITLVAEAVYENGQRLIVGMIVVWLIVDEIHIGTVAVEAGFRRMGVGRQLVARTLLAGAARGGSMAFLEVRRSNLGAQALYQQMGFEMAGERRRYYHDNQEDALLMTLNRLNQAILSRWVV